ncbi:threonine aldolase [Olivibacter sp. SDN3]|uniref:threonine aldolase family protein n=1 Tax=Olivibacter sp. SDN3 TaxID=2764720 RepID=UPI001651601B|nr:beta-eliminating lyase-related protein [Olivibacter sp. SDN3]QNL51280.1 threonine aldolase [Olivibacter sp. SDN3]
MKSFASDNYAGAIPEVIASLINENNLHAPAYGNDQTTSSLKKSFASILNREQLSMYLVFNGTGANLLGLSCMVDPFSSVLCAETAHIYVDESTAPETLMGCRLLPLKVDNQGKLSVDIIEKSIKRQGDLHHPQAKVLSIAQPTEYGTLYTLDELQKLGELTRRYKLLFHIDGSRIFTAATALGCELKDIIAASDVDVISIGGTKAGMLYGEAVLIFNPICSEKAPFLHKRSMQLASKNRFIAAQFLALLHQKTWQKYSSIALARTKKLANTLKKYPQITLTKPVEVNAIFATMPAPWIPLLQEEFSFYTWDESIHEVRLMCSFDTLEDEIERFDKKLSLLNKESLSSYL